LVAALDTALSPELIAEGRAREIVHRLQTLRKEAGLDVADRIEIEYSGPEELERAIQRFADYLRRETLAISLQRSAAPTGFTWNGQIDHLPLRLGLQRVKG
jgi:isoleucyl-tRNA synthetase